MSEQKLIKEQLLKNMLYSFIAFTIIFTVFGITISNNLKASLYQAADTELLSVRKAYNEATKIFNVKGGGTVFELTPNTGGAIIGARSATISINPRITYIIRDEDGEIQNATTMGRFYSDYSDYITFNNNNMDRVYDIEINKYMYRGMNLKITDENSNVNYVQLLINVDAEKNIIDNYLSILTLGIIITIVLSILASYILSKYALDPIVKSWEKQNQFVQNASHELRTPLTIIQAKQELLLQEPESKIIDKSEDISLSLNEVKRLGKLTKDLMFLARGDSNEDTLVKENISIDNLIQEVVIPYKEFAQMQDKKIELDLKYNKEILIDRNKIHQLLIILLDNAIKYTKEGDYIEIDTYEKDNKCVIEVRDAGIGVSDETIEHAFDRFYREDKARNRESGGSGLGLAIAHYIVEKHGGTIKLDHNKPKGTIVVVRLSR